MSAILDEVIDSQATGDLRLTQIPLSCIHPDPAQARDEGADDELADSIKANGVIKPIEVRPLADAIGQYMIVDGERRWRGAKKAGLDEIPAIVRDSDDVANEGDRLLRQVIHNDGKRLRPMEEARTWKRIMAAKSWNAQQLTQQLGLKKSTVSDRLAILEVPAAFVPYFERGQLSAAAAPILRPLAELPQRKLEAVTKFILEDEYDFRDAASDSLVEGKPIPLEGRAGTPGLQQIVQDALRQELRPIENAKLRAEYKGKTVDIGKTTYAVDVAAYDALKKKASAAAAKDSPAAPAPKREPSQWEIDQRKKQKAARAKSELRVLQAQELARKLPVRLDRPWALFLVRYLVRDIGNDTRRSAVKILGLVPEKMNDRGFTFDKVLLKYAEGLKTEQLLQLAITLLVAADVQVSSYSISSAPQRLIEAAKLAHVDLSKVKAQKEEKPAPAPKTKGKRRPYPDFMAPHQPDAALGAIVGTMAQPRTEITKKLWGYIKKHGLQDTKERRMINCDAAMQAVLGKKRVSMFEMTKAVNKHMKPAR